VRNDRLDGVGNSFLKQTSSGSGGVVKVDQIRLSYFAMRIGESERHF